jgi:hypothetical protein
VSNFASRSSAAALASGLANLRALESTCCSQPRRGRTLQTPLRMRMARVINTHASARAAPESRSGRSRRRGCCQST